MSDLETACPVAYRYRPDDFRNALVSTAETAYVIGGLYGNVDALRTILQMQQRELDEGQDVALVFNGDHNWFNIDPEDFAAVNQVALSSISIRGNVEAELSEPSGTGCGCNYPDYFNAEYVERSNAIMARLQATAVQYPTVCAALQALPLYRVLQVGASRIGVVHGDAESLSGWAFAAERLSAIGKCCSGDEASPELTPDRTLEAWIRAANVDAFASSHTCLAHARGFIVDGRVRAVFNNGAAGLPNFSQGGYGLITRISKDPRVPKDSLYGLQLNGVRFDALPVRYDTASWVGRFLKSWPPGSPAYEAYFQRIVRGPDFDLHSAVGHLVTLSER